ncbi:MAG: hypothetical protein IPJ42_22250 [Betaproteobacteria bacterium]|mgnify:FL=1|nr:hypothetical protein [Betaproteobacteria bacterium]
MSDDFGFAPPPFKPEPALVTLRRSLRDLGLAERGTGFELRGKRVLELSAEGDTIRARLARRLMLTPEWDSQVLEGAADIRKLLDEVKHRLARWERED